MSGYIPFLRVSKLKDLELESVLTLIIKLLKDSGLPLEVVTIIYTDLVKLLEQLQQAMSKSRVNELTAEIRETDELRISHVGSLFKGVDYFQTLVGSPMVEVAKVVDTVLEKYGMKIVHEGDKVTTVKIRSMVKDLKEAAIVAATDTLGLTEVVTALESSNEKFDALYLERANDEAEDAIPNLVPTRKSINDRCYMFIYLFNFLYEKDPETYGVVAGKMSEIVGDMMTVAKARETRISHDSDEPAVEVDVDASEGDDE